MRPKSGALFLFFLCAVSAGTMYLTARGDAREASLASVARPIFADNPSQGPYDAPKDTVTSQEPKSADETVGSGTSGKPTDKASGDCTKAKKEAAQKAGTKALQQYEAKCAAKKGKVTWKDISGVTHNCTKDDDGTADDCKKYANDIAGASLRGEATFTPDGSDKAVKIPAYLAPTPANVASDANPLGDEIASAYENQPDKLPPETSPLYTADDTATIRDNAGGTGSGNPDQVVNYENPSGPALNSNLANDQVQLTPGNENGSSNEKGQYTPGVEVSNTFNDRFNALDGGPGKSVTLSRDSSIMSSSEWENYKNGALISDVEKNLDTKAPIVVDMGDKVAVLRGEDYGITDKGVVAVRGDNLGSYDLNLKTWGSGDTRPLDERIANTLQYGFIDTYGVPHDAQAAGSIFGKVDADTGHTLAQDVGSVLAHDALNQGVGGRLLDTFSLSNPSVVTGGNLTFNADGKDIPYSFQAYAPLPTNGPYQSPLEPTKPMEVTFAPPDVAPVSSATANDLPTSVWDTMPRATVCDGDICKSVPRIDMSSPPSGASQPAPSGEYQPFAFNAAPAASWTDQLKGGWATAADLNPSHNYPSSFTSDYYDTATPTDHYDTATPKPQVADNNPPSETIAPGPAQLTNPSTNQSEGRPDTGSPEQPLQRQPIIASRDVPVMSANNGEFQAFCARNQAESAQYGLPLCGGSLQNIPMSEPVFNPRLSELVFGGPIANQLPQQPTQPIQPQPTQPIIQPQQPTTPSTQPPSGEPTPTPPTRPVPTTLRAVASLRGTASYYCPDSRYCTVSADSGGMKLATGGRYNAKAYEMALRLDLAKQYGCGYTKTCKALVEYQGKQLVVTINDNGPLPKGRIIDLNDASMRYLSGGRYGGGGGGTLTGVKVTILSDNTNVASGPIESSSFTLSDNGAPVDDETSVAVNDEPPASPAQPTPVPSDTSIIAQNSTPQIQPGLLDGLIDTIFPGLRQPQAPTPPQQTTKAPQIPRQQPQQIALSQDLSGQQIFQGPAPLTSAPKTQFDQLIDQIEKEQAQQNGTPTGGTTPPTGASFITNLITALSDAIVPSAQAHNLEPDAAQQLVGEVQKSLQQFHLTDPKYFSMAMGILAQETNGLNVNDVSPANARNIGQNTYISVKDSFEGATPDFIRSPLIQAYGSPDNMYQQIAGGNWRASVHAMAAEMATIKYRYGLDDQGLVAAYNGGPSRGRSYMYGGGVPAETANYVPRVMTWGNMVNAGMVPSNQRNSVAWSAVLDVIKSGAVQTGQLSGGITTSATIQQKITDNDKQAEDIKKEIAALVPSGVNVDGLRQTVNDNNARLDALRKELDTLKNPASTGGMSANASALASNIASARSNFGTVKTGFGAFKAAVESWGANEQQKQQMGAAMSALSTMKDTFKQMSQNPLLSKDQTVYQKMAADMVSFTKQVADVQAHPSLSAANAAVQKADELVSRATDLLNKADNAAKNAPAPEPTKPDDAAIAAKQSEIDKLAAATKETQDKIDAALKDVDQDKLKPLQEKLDKLAEEKKTLESDLKTAQDNEKKYAANPWMPGSNGYPMRTSQSMQTQYMQPEYMRPQQSYLPQQYQQQYPQQQYAQQYPQQPLPQQPQPTLPPGGNPPPGNTTPYAIGSCTPNYVCAGTLLYRRDTQCVDSPVQTCPYGCASGACTPPPSPTLTAQISCDPKTVQNIDQPITISWSCINGTSTGIGFDTHGARNGTATSSVPHGAAIAKFAVTCTDGAAIASSTCGVIVESPSIAIVFNPTTAAASSSVQVSWAAAGASACIVYMPNAASVSGGSTGSFHSPLLTRSSTVRVICKTQNGGLIKSSAVVNVTGDDQTPLDVTVPDDPFQTVPVSHRENAVQRFVAALGALF